MTELYLVRHGQARLREWQQYGPDPALTPLGRAQAAQRGAWLAAQEPFARLYCSPLRRAQETAQLAGAALGRRPVIVPALAEWEPPRYLSPMRWGFNRALHDSEAARPSARLLLWGLRDPWRVGRMLQTRLPTWARFVRRVGHVTAQVAARHAGERVVLVSHGGTIRATLAYYGLVPPNLYHYDTFGLCSVTILHLPAHGRSTLLASFADCTTIPDG